MSKRLKILIIEKGIKQTEMAREIGWSDGKISDIINLRRIPNEEDVRVLAGFFKMKPEKLRRVCGWTKVKG